MKLFIQTTRPTHAPYGSKMVKDYRKLNDNTIEDGDPLPKMDDILENLDKCSYFSTLDLA